MSGARRTTDSWWGATAPPTRVSIAAATYIGVEFEVTAPGRVFGFRIYLGAGDNNDHWGILWRTDVTDLLAARGFRPPDVGGSNTWRNVWIHPTVHVEPGVIYRLAVMSASAYWRQGSAVTTPVTHGNIKMRQGFQTTAANPKFATITLNANANGVDLLYQAD